MRLSRKTRFIAALVALFSLLFTQLAVAAYTCSATQASQAMEAVAMARAESHHHMEGCSESRHDETALCHAHCQPDSQSLDRPAGLDIPPFVAIAIISSAIDVAVSIPTNAFRPDDVALRRITSPPLAIRHCCFRI